MTHTNTCKFNYNTQYSGKGPNKSPKSGLKKTDLANKLPN